MSGVVLDTSVVLGWLHAGEPWHAQAAGLMQDVAAGALEAWVGPTFRFELTNSLVRDVGRGRIDWSGVEIRLARVDQFRLPVDCQPIERGEVLGICRAYGVRWPDAHLVLVAVRRGLPLIAADRRLVAALARAPVWAESILDRPSERAEPGTRPARRPLPSS